MTEFTPSSASLSAYFGSKSPFVLIHLIKSGFASLIFSKNSKVASLANESPGPATPTTVIALSLVTFNTCSTAASASMIEPATPGLSSSVLIDLIQKLHPILHLGAIGT